MKRRARASIAISALAVLFSSPASAQPSATETDLAVQLFEEAEKLMVAGNPTAACPKYAESQRRDPQLGTLLHLADCHEKVGKLASAWAGYKAAAEIAARRNAGGGYEPRERVARARAAALEPKLSTVVIHVAQSDFAGLEIRRDGEPLGRSAWGSTIPVDPGKYTFAAQAPGKKLWTKTVDVRASGAKIDVTVPALEDVTAGTPPPATDQPGRGATQRTAGYVLTGLGVIGAGVGVVFGLKVRSQQNDIDAICMSNKCTDEEIQRIRQLEDEARPNAAAFNVASVLAGAATLAGIALVLTAPSGPSSSATGISVIPWGGPNAAGGSIAGRW
jgi:hypothetical protein